MALNLENGISVLYILVLSISEEKSLFLFQVKKSLQNELVLHCVASTCLYVNLVVRSLIVARVYFLENLCILRHLKILQKNVVR